MLIFGRRDTNFNDTPSRKALAILIASRLSVLILSLDLRGLGRCHNDAREAELNETACKNEVSGTSLIADQELVERK